MMSKEDQQHLADLTAALNAAGFALDCLLSGPEHAAARQHMEALWATWRRLRGTLPTRPDPAGTYLVVVTGHFLVVRGRKAIDNQVKEWRWLKDMKHRRCRVQTVGMILT